MGILDYIRSRMEDGDPEFDLDWEIAREMANDHAESRFAAKKPTLSASVGKANIALAQGRTGESVASDKSIPQNAASSQVKPGDDTAYLNTVKRGDMETAQRMVHMMASAHGRKIYGLGFLPIH